MKRGCLIPLIALLVILLCAGAVIVGYVLLAPTASKPAVLINSPRAGERVATGQETIIHAIARDAHKIKRVELWIDGQLQDAQSSSVLGGVSPFPMLANWRPSTPGAHNLIVRAYNARNGRGQASISVDATQTTDRDNDGASDATDACPDQPGSFVAQGCPDRDSDGVRDSEDTCPDQPGLPSARGCPTSSANDRDGDGTLDSTDACPDQPGSPLAGGCSDTDGDGVRDSADTCPREPGPPERSGCPTPGDRDGDGVADATDACPDEPGSAALSGCLDSDGDGVRDRDDACPDVPGVPGLAGCPDRDGDSVRDAIDLCPDTPGPRDNAGCPVTGAGDSDGDGVHDDTDLSPSEPGPAESGGAPLPGDEAFEDLDPLGGFFGDLFGTSRTLLAKTLVQVEALEFQVQHDYSEIYCYAGVPDSGMERYGPFRPLGNRQWDIAEHIGGRNSRTITVLLGEPLRLRIECFGIVRPSGEPSEAVFDLGSVTRSYPMGRWDGHVITELSGMTAPERGTPGHSFQIKFRLCLGSCEATAFPAPELNLMRYEGGLRQLLWNWAGNRDNITGFRLYINGNRRVERIPADRSLFNLTSEVFQPPCGETYTYHITAFHREGGYTRESPPSNSVSWEGEPCPRRVRVTFARLYLDTSGVDDWAPVHGPHYGSLWATGIREQRLEFRDGECHSFLWIYTCRGVEYVPMGSIARFFADIRARLLELGELGRWNLYAPEVDYVIVELGQNDDLTIGARIMDEDVYSSDDTFLNASHTIGAGETLPAEVTLRSGRSFVVVRLEELR